MKWVHGLEALINLEMVISISVHEVKKKHHVIAWYDAELNETIAAFECQEHAFSCMDNIHRAFKQNECILEIGVHSKSVTKESHE